jgi:hypothetical protein
VPAELHIYLLLCQLRARTVHLLLQVLVLALARLLG